LAGKGGSNSSSITLSSAGALQQTHSPARGLQGKSPEVNRVSADATKRRLGSFG